MTAIGTGRAARARWALSFADLSLLMLGFFVLLQANQSTRDETLVGLNSYFAGMRAPNQVDLPAAQLFAPGEALLSEAGRNRLLAAVRPIASGKSIIRIQSLGLAQGEHRFDAWDLSAARLGAIARALVAAGIAPDRVRIAGLAEPDGSPAKGQTIRLVEHPVATE
ncbi:MAG: OmpA family protein [Sphingobium sp.]|nr:OmpA family protein [Sphingobium sp.]